MKVAPIQSNFGAGEISPLVQGRVDIERYKAGLDTCENAIPTIQGGLIRRSGTMFVNEVKTSAYRTRIFPFEFSIEQAYILEFGHNYIRFYKDNALIETSPGVAYELGTPYSSAAVLSDLFEIKYAQSADVLYLVHPDYAPRKLSRTSDIDWTLTTIDFLDGPFLGIRDFGVALIKGTGIETAFTDGTTASKITPGAASGATTLTVSSSSTVTGAVNNGSGLIRITMGTADLYSTGARVQVASVGGTVEANGTWILTRISSTQYDLQGSAFVNAYTAGGTVTAGLFRSQDVGRLVRLKHSSTWGWGVITAYTNAATVSFTVRSTLGGTGATEFWRLGAWYTGNYPSTITFHEDRLVLAGAADEPQRIDGSNSGDYENFAASDTSGTQTASNAWTFTLGANDVNAIRWLSSDEKGLVVGTVSSEWVIRPSSTSEALSPVNVSGKRTSSYGSADIQAIQSGRATLFIQRSAKKLREFSYFYDVDGFRATDLSVLSEHITGDGVVEMAVQREPQNIIWAVREDGQLIGVTYERDLDNLRVGWHRHIIGGVSDAAGTQALVESIAVIPSADGSRQELWLVVKRLIYGAEVRYIEYMTQLWEESLDQPEGYFVDCGLTWDDPKTITAISTGAYTEITSNSHGFLNGDKVLISKVNGMTFTNADGDSDSINGKTYTVANKTANTFQITEEGDPVVSTTYTPYISAGYARKLVTTISGLDHLEGETLSVCTDGAAHPEVTVDGGEITLQNAAATVHVGYGFTTNIKLLRIEAGSAIGSSLGQSRRINRCGFLVHRSLGMKIGTDFSRLDPVTFRKTSDQTGAAPPLFSGIIHESIEADHDYDNQICIRQDQPLPLILLAVMPQMVENDR